MHVFNFFSNTKLLVSCKKKKNVKQVRIGPRSQQCTRNDSQIKYLSAAQTNSPSFISGEISNLSFSVLWPPRFRAALKNSNPRSLALSKCWDLKQSLNMVKSKVFHIVSSEESDFQHLQTAEMLIIISIMVKEANISKSMSDCISAKLLSEDCISSLLSTACFFSVLVWLSLLQMIKISQGDN